MALSQIAHFALSVAFFGTLAFILGVIAENKKPAAGTPIQGKDVIICKYPRKAIKKSILFQNMTLLVFFIVALVVFVLAEGMMMWATITEGLHRSLNVHHDLQTQCPTAKTGLFGGAAFLALDASLFWLVCQMLTQNVRADYFDEDDPKGDYGQVLATDYDANGAGLTAAKV
ncbi:hypothetical protein J5N97_013986 [Dioscorea zingiberensis]|uniref:Uncharacterized protein n=1 Tax=Dioscorea zingiberensis TaxID=325984 RepID=A0A9D5HJL9_9LILI|nr:hypothetical protein J5N97_013986 [Dioscorea zingiberensis]